MKIGDLVRYALYLDLDLVGLVREVHRTRSGPAGRGRVDIVHIRFHDGTEVAEKSTCFEVVSAAR